MDDLRFVAERGNERFEIIEGSGEGFYVVRYVDGVSTHDYLQDDVSMAYLCAEDEWGIPSSAWRLPLPGEIPFWQQQKTPGYSHTQRAPLCLLVYSTAIALIVAAWFTRDEFPIALILGGSGVLMLILAMAFHQLTVEDQVEQLSVRFGPLPLFRRSVTYTDMERVEVGRTLLLDGWGIHYSIRCGWLWNLWGRECVVVHFRNGRVLRIGTDDAGNLAGFLEGKISEQGK